LFSASFTVLRVCPLFFVEAEKNCIFCLNRKQRLIFSQSALDIFCNFSRCVAVVVVVVSAVVDVVRLPDGFFRHIKAFPVKLICFSEPKNGNIFYVYIVDVTVFS